MGSDFKCMQTMRFAILLVVKDSGPKTKKEFPVQHVPSHAVVGVNVGHNDILQNFCNIDDVTMNGNIPWRGPREKARQFIKMLVEALSKPGDIVIDSTTTIGSLFTLSCLLAYELVKGAVIHI